MRLAFWQGELTDRAVKALVQKANISEMLSNRLVGEPPLVNEQSDTSGSAKASTVKYIKAGNTESIAHIVRW